MVATGHLFESDYGGLLCQALIALAPHTPPRCAFDVLAPVTGVDVRQIGGEVGGQWVTDYIQVEGVWTEGAIAASDVEFLERPRLEELLSPIGRPAVPCEAPPGGWTTYPDGAEGERAADALQEEVEKHPEKYSGLWNGEINGASGSTVDLVVVVGTVEDVESVAAELRSIYPFNLCVTHADYGLRDMQKVVESLAAEYPDWDIYVAPSIGRIVVRLPAFDSRAADAVRPYEHQVVVLPIVRHLRGWPSAVE